MKRDILYILLFLGIVLVTIWTYKTQFTGNEGFQQNDRFLLKTDEDSYDHFYGETYDKIMNPRLHTEYFLDVVINTVQPDANYSVFLDVGSGTGSLVHQLKTLGYRAYGIDQSQDMNDIALEKYPELELKCDSVINPMAFDRALFTHIFCTYYTIYEIENKTRFFNNCYFWLQNNGYIILHLVDRDGFTPAVATEINDNPLALDKRTIDFGDFEYHAEYIPLKEKRMIFKESFKDKETQNIRQNERTLYMESIDTILALARQSGFIVKGSFTLEKGPCKDKHQQIVILERLS
jgi:SAM-dependent methyltransferase